MKNILNLDQKNSKTMSIQEQWLDPDNSKNMKENDNQNINDSG